MDELTDNTEIQLWQMSEHEKQAIRMRTQEVSIASKAKESEAHKLIAIHAVLIEKYPLPWDYKRLVERYGEAGGEIAYIEESDFFGAAT
jgi:hypothetical protein